MPRFSAPLTKDEGRKIQCAGKVSFASWSDAKTAAARRANRQVYNCRHCHRFHVGTQAPRDARGRE
jgi:nitrate/TMAO reductase-like tetraheme cytochrome c subunit